MNTENPKNLNQYQYYLNSINLLYIVPKYAPEQFENIYLYYSKRYFWVNQ